MLIFAIIFVFMVLLGGLTLSYQIFKLVALDAESRGLKHPKLWGMFSLSGNQGGGGLILYLIGRNRYVSNMTDAARVEFDSRKRRAALSLSFYCNRNDWSDVYSLIWKCFFKNYRGCRKEILRHPFLQIFELILYK